MRFLRLIIVGLFICGLSSGILLNNLWRFLPEFHRLDIIFSVPLYVQIALLIISISLGLVLYRKIEFLKILPLFIFALVLSMASWYQVILSNNVNSLTIELYPFYQREVKFDAITTVKMEDHKIILMTDSKILTIYTGLYPFGLNHNILRETLISYGNCVHSSDDRCNEIEFVWP